MSRWIFGYGSLIWRPDFPYTASFTGYIDHWLRRFYQGSTDHRGVPESPGRVVTLLPQTGARCFGVAYEVDADQMNEIFAQLDYREKGGYDRFTVAFHPSPVRGREAFPVWVYVAHQDNPNYLGPAPAADMARQILGARGPSGHNTDYLLELATALRSMKAEDPHVFELEDLVRRLLDQRPRDIKG